MRKNKAKPDRADVARKLLAARDRGKEAYSEADAMLALLMPLVDVGEVIELGGGRVAKIVDNFADRNVVWKPAGVRRFDLETSQT